MITIQVGRRSYKCDDMGNFQTGQYWAEKQTREREARRERLDDHAKKQGYRSMTHMRFAEKSTGGGSLRQPKHPGRTRALARDAREKAKRLGLKRGKYHV